jgi:hypothetical protein
VPQIGTQGLIPKDSLKRSGKLIYGCLGLDPFPKLTLLAGSSVFCLYLHTNILTETVDRQLGLEIPPEKIRLQPRHDDPYRWSVAKPVKHLFKSNLSSGSVGYFQKICEALESGDLIEAVAPQTLYQEDPCQEACVAVSKLELIYGLTDIPLR